MLSPMKLVNQTSLVATVSPTDLFENCCLFEYFGDIFIRDKLNTFSVDMGDMAYD